MTKKIAKIFSTFNPKYTFELFVQGAGNHLAYDSAIVVANRPSDTYNPLFIYGGVGLGKTHLLNSIGLSIRENSPELNVCYCSAEKFMIEMVNHLRLKKMDQFRNGFRRVDVLLIDDIQFLSGRTGTQEEFFHTFNALYEANKQIVITSGEPFRKIADIEERLRSRLEGGLVVEIEPPDMETRISILNNISEVRKIPVPAQVIQYIALSEISDIRQLEGMLICLDAYSNLKNRPITLEITRENLKNILGN